MSAARAGALLVVNPTARSVTPGRRDQVASVLEGSFRLETAETKAPGHAGELAAAATEDGLDLVVVLGGDGTLNEVANALAGTEVPVAVLPGGQANVFSRSLGLPTDLVAAARIVVARASHSRRVPLGRLDGRWFTSNCGVGFDAAIVRAVEASPGAKRRLGDWFFVWTALRLYARGFDRSTPHLSVRWGPGPDGRADHQFMAVVQNLTPYTYFGRHALRMCPDASLDAGLDCLTLGSMGIRTVLPVVMSVFARAGHGDRRHVGLVHDVTRVDVEADAPVPVQADGEYLGQHTAARIESVPGALRVVG